MSARRKFSGPRNRGPWYGLTVQRLQFERGVKDQFHNLKGERVRKGYKGYEYRLTVPVRHYEPRKVRIRFNGMADVPSVFADGPQKSPHRYSDGSLCMWYPYDPTDRRWVFEDGLVALVGLVMAHLFREAWWREKGEWPGEEVPHGPQAKEQPAT